ncbi:MAG: lipoprotein signal peptidase [Bacteroidales bacterium]|nr:lipoprotein signal peptidase [Bacteroidales bacterium]
MTVTKKSLILIILILVIDQVLKIWVKTHMVLGQEYRIIGDWFIIHFIENNGMAFGMEIAGKFGKILLTIFRIIAIIGIGFYLKYLIREKANTGLIICISLVFAGALGNIIDSIFYGMIFNESYLKTATLFPPDGGYSSLLHGKVVDMFYFPVIKSRFPDWFPFWGSESLVFFRPVFNIADASITTGVISILVFQRKLFKK